MSQTVHPTPPAPPPAAPEPRLKAYLLDRALGWGASALVAWLAFPHRFGAAVALFVVLVLLAGVAGAATLAATGRTPGKAAFGLRVVRRDGGLPAFGPVLLRAAVLGAGGIPTAGLGAVALAWTALTDPTGRRRGLHDRLGDTSVVSARVTPEAGPEPETPELVNLTALRLLPDPEPLRPGTTTGPVPPHGTASSSAGWRVVLDTGESLVLDAGHRLAPAGPPLPEGIGIALAPDGALVVVDRGSETGCVVVRKGHERVLPPGRPATLVEGDVVRLGARTMRVERAS